MGPAPAPCGAEQAPEGGGAPSSSAAAAGAGEAPEEEEEDLPLAGFGLRGGILDEDDDPVEPLAAGEVSALPPAPPREKPKACDADLDMFGEPEEDSAEVVE